MRLKALEIKGFKSFADETVIHFDGDVIGIVGPNGSGKSNIVDAIRWVLGEQKSKELRLDQMSSVIFNGTKKRKPGGIAQVSLTFENTKNILPTEYHTVTISRILYRSGESEYQLNGVTCRLRDITSLFLDTGIGSNSYAIIALGMVDDILNDKEHSRRRMFEQAAGVSKYKIRKRETLSKLDSTQADLARVDDLLFEIEGNLQTLEKQAKRTKKYFEMKEEYKVLSVQLATLRIDTLKTQQKTLRTQLEQEEDRHRQLEIECHQLEAKLESEKKANLDQEKSLSDRQRDLNTLVGKLRGLENDKKMAAQRLDFVRQNESRLSEQIRNAEIRIQQLEGDIEHYRSELNAEKRVESRLDIELSQAETALKDVRASHTELKAGLDAVLQQQQTYERALFDLEKRRAIAQNQTENHQQDLDRSAADVQQRRESIDEIEGLLRNIEVRENERRQSLEALEQAEQKRQSDQQQLEQEIEQFRQKIGQINREIDAKRNEYKLTKSMVENLEGFPESIRFLQGHKKWRKDTPLLSDLIYVKEESRVAIENFLEPYLNYYVVQNLEEAYEAIQLLNQSQKGKANFFLLDAFEDYAPPMTLLPDAVQAIDHVQTDPAYVKLVSYLLENVLLTDREDAARQTPPGEVVMLSKTGHFIRKRFSLTGGSIGLFEGKKIGRKKNLEILEKEIAKLEKEENQLSTIFFERKDQLEALRKRPLSPEIQREREALNKIGQEKVTLFTRLENFETFIKESDQKRDATQGRIASLMQEIGSVESAIQQQQGALTALKDQLSNTDDTYRQVSEQLSQASTAYNEKNVAFIRQQNKVAALQQELTFREKQLGETRQVLEQHRQTLGRSGSEIEQVLLDIQKFEQDLVTAYKERKERESVLTEAEQTYFQARGQINEIENQLRKATKSQSDTQILINTLKEKYNDVRYQITTVAERLRIEFSMDINELVNQEPNRSIEEGQLTLQVERLKSRLDNYGEINPMAVQAYDEMKERHDTISVQRDDILAAKASLLETIKEIEETATAQFLTAFDQARLYFIEVFRSLFTEDDTADLILVKPEDPLESDIEIVAKPKGKRPQTISQLSGGEKTLTATALLFALYLLKPAPFCIFDEVDAPLDDANIEKFNRIIKKFSTESQFIIVTHNKLTMAAVDTIYGVFMPDQGVSAVAQVDFRDFEHKATFEAVS